MVYSLFENTDQKQKSMKKHKLLITIVLVFTSNLMFGQSSETVSQYIDTYKNIAITEEMRTGVPATITLAQDIHETRAGTSTIVLSSNNKFVIRSKCDGMGL